MTKPEHQHNFSNKYADFYDSLHENKPYQEEADFVFDKSAQYVSSPAKSLIDLACGTGRHIELFHKKGLYVHGNDLSHMMIGQSKVRLADLKSSDYQLSVGPMQDVAATPQNQSEGFDIATALYTAIGYLVEPQDLNRFFTNLQKTLRPGGVFFADVWNGFKMATGFSPSRERSFETQKYSILRTSTNSHIPEKNALKVHFDFKVFNKDTKEETQFDETHLVRYFTGIEIETLLEAHGFKLKEIGPFFDSEEKSNFANAWNFYFVAERL